MAFDLRKALLRKGEHESARLMDFEFRHRARTFRLMADALGVDAEALVKRIVHSDDEGVIGWLAEQSGRGAEQLIKLAGECSVRAREELIREIGDPTPNRLL